MRQRQAGQSVIEFAIAAPVAMALLWTLLALGQIVRDYADLSYASRQAAFAAARAPSEASAQQRGAQAALESTAGSPLRHVTVSIETGGFQRNGVVHVTTAGYADLGLFPIVNDLVGSRFQLTARASQAIETYRSRTP